MLAAAGGVGSSQWVKILRPKTLETNQAQSLPQGTQTMNSSSSKMKGLVQDVLGTRVRKAEL